MTKQRRSNWTPVIVSNLGNQDGDVFRRHTSSASYVTYIDEFHEDASDFFDQKTRRRADLSVAAWIALALALPAVIGFCICEATKSIVLIAS